jgi:hypothetical protein
VSLSIDCVENFIDTGDIAEVPVFSLQASGINDAEPGTRDADRFSSDDDAAFSLDIYHLPLAGVESV